MKRCRDRDGLAHVLLVGLAGLCLSCHPNSPSPEVEYSGCWTVSLPGPVCALWPGPEPKLRLWVKADPGTKVEIQAGDRLLTERGEELDGGRRYRLSLPQEDSRLTLRLRQADGTRGPSWALSLTRTEMPAWMGEIARLRQDGKKSEIRQRLLQLAKIAPRKERGLVLGSLAFMARGDGDDEAYASYLEEGIAVDRAEKRLSDEVVKATQLAGLHLNQWRFSDARQTLNALRLPPGAPAEATWLVAYYKGLLGDAVGDYRSALEQLRKAEDLAERVGLIKYRWDAEQVLARVLQSLGRSQEAAELFASLRADPHPSNPCDLGDMLTNLGWSRLLAREAGEPAEDPTPELEQAQIELERNECPPGQRLNPLLNLALAHQQEGRWPEARRRLDQARLLAAHPDLRARLWWDELEARAALAEGHSERALGLYQKLERMAELALSPEGLLLASLGQADARIKLGQRSAALAALAKADRQIDEQSWHIPAREGRDTFIAQREAVTRLYLELLLADGQPQRAFAVARQARSRLLRRLTVTDRLTQLKPDERETWERSLSRYLALRDTIDRQAAEEWLVPGDRLQRAREERVAQLAEAQDVLDRALASLGDPGQGSLSPPGPGEVILVYHPLRRGWVGFAATQRGVDVNKFDLPEATLENRGELSFLLLKPFRQSIQGAERVRVLPYGPLRSVDFHMLSFAGEPLLAHHLVVYSLDLPVRSSSAPPGRPVALLVSDPQGNLPAAQEEAAVVGAAFREGGAGWSLKRLDGPEARAEAVRAALPGTGLFHYAGHGVFAGFAGWDSELPLADGSRLTLGDVLALRPAPTWVVLSACDAGRSSEQASGEGIGLAHAFLLAGAQAVIAANRPVADTTAHDLVRELYRGWRPGVDLPRQLQRAQLARGRAGSSADAGWASFRLLVP